MNEKLSKALEKGGGVPVAPLAHHLGVTPQTIYARIRSGNVRVIETLGGRVKRIPADEARRLLGMDKKAS